MDDLRSSPTLPVALLHASALVAQEFPVRFFDRRLHVEDWESELIRRLTPDVFLVGVTAFTGPMIRSSLEMCRLVRRLRPELPIVWGGIHASLLPQQTAADPLVDYVVEGEGEYPLRDLARALAANRRPTDIPGVWYKEGDQVKGMPGAPLGRLDDLPAPPWHLVEMDRYQPRYNGRRSLCFQSSRGCPLNCSYCYNVVFSRRRWRALSPERTIEQVRQVVERHGVEDVYFVDDMFFTNRKRALAIAEALKPLGVTWQVQGVDILGLKRMSDDDYGRILDSGCGRLTVGIESGSPRVREAIHKDGTIEDILDVTRRLARFPITLFYSFMCGIPTETLEEVRMTVDLMFKLMALNRNVRVSPVYTFTPYPGTELFEIALQHGLRPPSTLDGWADFRYDQSRLFPQNKALYEALYFTSLFLDDKAREYGAPGWARVLAKMYRPVARLRAKNFFFKGLVEKRAMDLAMTGWRGEGGDHPATSAAHT
ncbi:MAG: B12-binding domain-containing radical SAM protein [Nitrospirae bacterium]|nr:B12-binding domain-containing radical SAM protein [Nitrospirota bacterium]